jgi:lipoprotein-anchoring transpeptidase ErfK/SrfK
MTLPNQSKISTSHRLAGLTVAVIVAGMATNAATAPPVAQNTLQQLHWPTTSNSARLPKASHVYLAPDKQQPLGKIASGTKLAIAALLPGDDTCQWWMQLQPRGVICTNALTPDDGPPAAQSLPIVAPGDLLPGEYFIADDAGVDTYRTIADAQAGTPTGEITGHAMLRSLETLWIDGMSYYRTDKAIVPTSQVRSVHPSDFAGTLLTKQIALPVTWVIATSNRQRQVVDQPKNRGATVLRSVERYQQVNIHGRSDRFVDIGGDQRGSEWISASGVATASVTMPPDGIAADAQWIDIDLTQQTLVAYVGHTPVFATLIASGKARSATPPGTYRILAKAAVTPMTSEAGERSQYDVSAVPWAMRFAKGLYLHAAYWHDGFGTRRSHGCINLSPIDARWLYNWALPAVPSGWSELEIVDGGVLIRIRD